MQVSVAICSWRSGVNELGREIRSSQERIACRILRPSVSFRYMLQRNEQLALGSGVLVSSQSGHPLGFQTTVQQSGAYLNCAVPNIAMRFDLATYHSA